MQFTPKESRKRPIKLENGIDAQMFPHNLELYMEPPINNITLQEFEDYAVHRVKVLKAVENVGVKHIKGSNDWKDLIAREFQNFKKLGILRSITDSKKCTEDDPEVYNERRKDRISHFILRLAYCRSEELRRWFITQEVDLFRYRFGLESNQSITKFLHVNHLNYSPIPQEEKAEVLKNLIDSCGDRKSVHVDNENYYKVPFTEALDLVRTRRVFLSKGYAYVPQSELVVIILSHFRANVSHALAVTARALPNLEEDGRLLPMLNNLSKRYLGQEYDAKKIRTGEITADMVDGLAKKDFPPCMQHLHQNMKANHHLRHHGRRQYGLFLKGIGLTLEEAMKFWKTEFMKLIDGDKFDKQYSYNIRHTYGKEGGRKNYTPMSCLTIITTNTPGVGDYHGCPFRHHDNDMLRQKLQTMNVGKADAAEVTDLAKKGHYQLACARYYEVTHNAERDSVSINHPNEYFDLTRKQAAKPEGGASNTPRSTPVIVKSQSRVKKSTSGDDFGDDIPLSFEDMEQAMQGVEGMQ